MADSSSHKPYSFEITPKEELVTLDKPESPNPFLLADQVEFFFEEIAFSTNNEVPLLYPSHLNSDHFRKVLDFISKCCLKEAFTRAPTQYKEYLSEFWYTAKTLNDSKIWVSTPTGGIRGDIGINTFRNALRAHYLPHSSGKIGGLDQISNKDATILYCLANEVKVDYAKLIWEDIIHKLNKITREKVIPYPRFISLLLEYMMPKYENEELTINPTQSSLAKDKSLSHPSPPTLVVGEMHKEAQQAAGGPTSLGATNEEGAHPQLSSGSNPSVLVDKTKSAGDGLKTAHTDSHESEEEDVDKEEPQDTSHDMPEDTSVPPPPSPKSTQLQELMAQARPSYPDVNQLTTLLVTSLKPELSKLLASHKFASCLLTELKELPLKFTELSGEIKELKQHVKDMDIELHGDLKEIPTKLETFTSTIFSLTSQVAEPKDIQWELPAELQALPVLVSSVQKQLKTLDSLPSLYNKVTKTLNRFATVVENALAAMTKDVPSAGQATASPAEGEKNNKYAKTNLKDELVHLLGTNVVTQYCNKKLLFDKYCDKMLKRKKSPKITNCEVLTKKGPITLNIYKEDGYEEVISNLKFESLKFLQRQLFRSLDRWEGIFTLEVEICLFSLLEENKLKKNNTPNVIQPPCYSASKGLCGAVGVAVHHGYWDHVDDWMLCSAAVNILLLSMAAIIQSESFILSNDEVVVIAWK
ncbi:hypothetical protein Tco_1002504 [Tanacetum coccineum]|uniref:Uncharacterized protein n=1 Tax=Tanacetum coccineum TaxID=301880 RepID=A0ABQ5F6G4_9ASTR